MTLSYSCSRKYIASITLAAMLVTQFGWLSVMPTYALVSTYTALETQANGNPIQSVTTFTITTAGLDTDSIGIDGCTITFTDFGTGDTDCTDGVGVIDSINNSSIAQQATALSAFTFINYSASSGGIGQFVLTHTGAPIDGNLAISTIGGVAISTSNTVVGLSSAVAQVVDFTPADPTVGETYVTTINTIVHNHIVNTPETVAQAVAGIVTSLSGNVSVSCVDNTIHATCTALSPGTPFTYIAGTQDITAPTVSLSLSGSSSPTNTGFTVVSTFSEPVYGVDISDFVVTNGTVSDFVAISPDGSGFSMSQMAHITPTTSGLVTIDMPTQAGVDIGGNDSNAATQFSVEYDITPPSVTINTIPLGITTVSGSFTVRSTFSDPVVGFSLSGFTVTNATLSAFTPLSSTIYQATVTPINAGVLTIDIGTGAATDIALNNNDLSNQLSITVLDTVAPVVTLVGSSTQSVTQGTSYIEQTATWTDYVDGTGTITPASSGTVDTSTLGTYILEYYYTDAAGNLSNTVTRTVNVVSAPDVTPPVVTLSGSASMTVAYGSIFADPGADWTDNFDGSAHIATASSGTVDTSTLGIYTLEYTYTDFAGNIGNTVTRTVSVTDQGSPIVTLQGSGSISLVQGSLYTESGATWTDAIDGTGTITPASSGTVDTSTLGTYILEYYHTDGAGNLSNIVTRTVDITDGTPPVVTLSGSSSMTIAHGATYTEQGATWTDTVDGSGTIALPSSGVVDTNIVGTYYLQYSITDTSGNISNTVMRTVLVTDQTAPVLVLDGAATISLMQGDIYTEQGATWTDAVEGVGNIFYGTYGATGSFQMSGSVNSAVLGTYIIDYLRVDGAGNMSNIVTRTITVTAIPDTTPPVITLIGSGTVTITQGVAYIEQGATWVDNYDGSGVIMPASSGSVNNMLIGTYILTYTRNDAAGNIGNTVNRTVTVLPDATPPVVTLIGPATQYLTQSGTYTEQGATWTDTVDGSGNTFTGTYAATGSFQVSGLITPTIVGTYILQYQKVDTTGNATTVIRTIIVSPPAPASPSVGGGGGVSYIPAVNTPPKNTVVIPVLSAAPDLTQSGTIDTTDPLGESTTMSPSYIKRKALRATLRTRAIHTIRGDVASNLSNTSTIDQMDTMSAPVGGDQTLEVDSLRLNVRIAPSTDAKIIGELKRGDTIDPTQEKNGWVEFQFGKIVGWVKKGFLTSHLSK